MSLPQPVKFLLEYSLPQFVSLDSSRSGSVGLSDETISEMVPLFDVIGWNIYKYFPEFLEINIFWLIVVINFILGGVKENRIRNRPPVDTITCIL